MSRFPEGDYDDEFWVLHQARWENNLKRTLVGKKGQAVLMELREALMAMPDHRLIAGDLARPTGDVCAIGALAAYRRARADGVSMTEAAKAIAASDPEPFDGFTYNAEKDRYEVEVEWQKGYKFTLAHGEDDQSSTIDHTVSAGKEAGMTETLAWFIGSLNDDEWGHLTPEQRWGKCLAWVERQILVGIPAPSDLSRGKP